MRRTGPNLYPAGILATFVLWVAPSLAFAQGYGPSMAASAQAEFTPPASTDPSAQRSARPAKSLMGMVMAGLIEAAEQSARQRRDATRQAAALDETQSPTNAGMLRHPDADASACKPHTSALCEPLAVQTDEPY